MNDFLKKIKQLESSGGKDTDHKLMTHGIQKGTRAIGDYGIMPNTALETLNRMRMSGTLPEQYRGLVGADPETMSQSLESDPELYNSVADFNAKRALDRTGGDEEKAAYMWNQGLNLDPTTITPEQLEKANYIQKFRKLQQKLNTP